MMLTGCNSESLLPPLEEDADSSSDAITLEFTMLTRNAESASAVRSGIPVAENPEIGFGAENYLDLDNLTFLLFDGDRKMLRTFSPEISVEESTSPYIKYRVKTFLHDKYFLEATSEDITFTIVTLGNYKELSPENYSYHIGQDLSEIFDPDMVATFTIPVSNNVSNTWIPTIAPATGQDIGHIPMAGMQTFTVKTAGLRESTPDRPYKLSDGSSGKEINILRALAKIEIVDKINYLTDDEEKFHIDKVELVGHATRGSILPSYNHWMEGPETRYVTAPSVPSSAEYRGAKPVAGLTTSSADNDALINFFHDTEASALRNDGGKVFSCYLTEYDPDMVGTVGAMWMRITMKSQNNDKTMQFRLEAAPYTDGQPGDPLEILRNNIYRYVITGANEIQLDVQPFANMELSFGFGLQRDSRGDLMILPDDAGEYPDYFEDFLREHGLPMAMDEDGKQTEEPIELQEGDYYAIVVGENEEMTQAVVWIKDRDGCRVLSNFGSVDDSQVCSARLVESFYNNTESERFYKDIFGFRRVYHFHNHNSIVRDPVYENLLFCMIENFQQEGETRKYYEVESWDETTTTGWIITKNNEGEETGFRKITSEGTLGESIPLN